MLQHRAGEHLRRGVRHGPNRCAAARERSQGRPACLGRPHQYPWRRKGTILPSPWPPSSPLVYLQVFRPPPPSSPYLVLLHFRVFVCEFIILSRTEGTLAWCARGWFCFAPLPAPGCWVGLAWSGGSRRWTLLGFVGGRIASSSFKLYFLLVVVLLYRSIFCLWLSFRVGAMGPTSFLEFSCPYLLFFSFWTCYF